MKIEASAPGKLFLSGEYAVLDRAPALVTAVDVRARCRFSDAPKGPWRLATLPVSLTPAVFVPGVDGIEWQGESVPLFEAAWAVLDENRRKKLCKSGASLVLDTSAFFMKESKLGLGSSAAALTALLGALWAASGGLPSEDKAFSAVYRAHAAWQKGGSGADLAAALCGGTILYRREPRVAAPVALPEGLEILPVWTGESASTADFLARFEAFQKANPEEFLARFKVLEQRAEEAALAASQGDAGVMLEALASYGGALKALGEAMGEAAGLAIWSERHREIAKIVEAAGGVYKPSGAGGGDIGLAFACGSEGINAVKSALSSGTCPVLPLRFGARGLHVENRQE